MLVRTHRWTTMMENPCRVSSKRPSLQDECSLTRKLSKLIIAIGASHSKWISVISMIPRPMTTLRMENSMTSSKPGLLIAQRMAQLIMRLTIERRCPSSGRKFSYGSPSGMWECQALSPLHLAVHFHSFKHSCLCMKATPVCASTSPIRKSMGADTWSSKTYQITSYLVF